MVPHFKKQPQGANQRHRGVCRALAGCLRDQSSRLCSQASSLCNVDPGPILGRAGERAWGTSLTPFWESGSVWLREREREHRAQKTPPHPRPLRNAASSGTVGLPSLNVLPAPSPRAMSALEQGPIFHHFLSGTLLASEFPRVPRSGFSSPEQVPLGILALIKGEISGPVDTVLLCSPASSPLVSPNTWALPQNDLRLGF